MMNSPEAVAALAEYDARKEAEAGALIAGMPVVQRYVEQHKPLWAARRVPDHCHPYPE